MDLPTPEPEAYYPLDPRDFAQVSDNGKDEGSSQLPELLFPDGRRITLSDRLFEAVMHLIEAANVENPGVRAGSVVHLTLLGHSVPDYAAADVIGEPKDELEDAIDRGDLAVDELGMIAIEDLLRFRDSQRSRHREDQRRIIASRAHPDDTDLHR